MSAFPAVHSTCGHRSGSQHPEVTHAWSGGPIRLPDVFCLASRVASSIFKQSNELPALKDWEIFFFHRKKSKIRIWGLSWNLGRVGHIGVKLSHPEPRSAGTQRRSNPFR